MFTIRILFLVCLILSSSQASLAGQNNRRDICPATVTIAAAAATSQAATSIIFVTVDPTTVTVMTSVCTWTSTSLFATVSSSTSSPVSSYPSSLTGSAGTSSTSGTPSQTISTAVSSSGSTFSAPVSGTPSQSNLGALSTWSFAKSAAGSSTSSQSTLATSSTSSSALSASASSTTSPINSAAASRSSSSVVVARSSTSSQRSTAASSISGSSTFSAATSSTPSSPSTPLRSSTALSSSLSSSNSLSSSSSLSSSITAGPALPSFTLYTTVADDVTITDTTLVDDYITSTINVNVYSTIYNVGPSCSAVPTIANPEFDTPLPDSWAEEGTPGAGYDISINTNYFYNGPDSAQFSFAAGSTKNDILSISQVVTVCPDQAYDFNIYGTRDTSNTGYCKAWITLDPQVGSEKVGNAVFFGYEVDPENTWAGIDASFFNTQTNSYQITLTISAYCVSSNSSALYLDTVTVGQE